MSYKQREWIFRAVGALFLLLLLFYLIFGMRTLIGALNAALNPSLIKPEEVVRFNLDKIKELHIPGVE